MGFCISNSDLIITKARVYLGYNKEVRKKAATNRPTQKNNTSMITEKYEIQTIDAHGIACTEYRYEPSVIEDDEPIEAPLVCGQCDYYQSSKADNIVGHCTLTRKARRSYSLACPKVFITCPF